MNVNINLMVENVIQIKWNNDKCWCKCKNPKKHHIWKKDYIWNPAICSCESHKYLASVIDDSKIKFEEIIDPEARPYNEETKTILTSLNEK